MIQINPIHPILHNVFYYERRVTSDELRVASAQDCPSHSVKGPRRLAASLRRRRKGPDAWRQACVADARAPTLFPYGQRPRLCSRRGDYPQAFLFVDQTRQIGGRKHLVGRLKDVFGSRAFYLFEQPGGAFIAVMVQEMFTQVQENTLPVIYGNA